MMHSLYIKLKKLQEALADLDRMVVGRRLRPAAADMEAVVAVVVAAVAVVAPWLHTTLRHSYRIRHTWHRDHHLLLRLVEPMAAGIGLPGPAQRIAAAAAAAVGAAAVVDTGHNGRGHHPVEELEHEFSKENISLVYRHWTQIVYKRKRVNVHMHLLFPK